MFDLSFTEIAIVGVVALVVIGPERLPKVARTAGHMFGRFQRYVATVKSDLQREMDASELAKVKQEVDAAARVFEQSVKEHANAFDSEVRALDPTSTSNLTPALAADPALPAPAILPSATPSVPPSPAADPPAINEPVSRPLAGGVPGEQARDAAFAQGQFDFGVEPVRRASTGGRV
jgi:sec-independent protein translocase protein TatB